MNNFLMEMQKASTKAKSSIDNSFEALSFIDTDFKQFLIDFFKEDINKNLLLTQIFYDSPSSIIQFQSTIFEKSCNFFSKLINIEGLCFHYDVNIPLSAIDFILSDTKVASVNIFYKQLILYEEVFFEQINKGLEDKISEKDILLKRYHQDINNLNNYSIFYKEYETGLTQHILNNTVLKKKAKREKLNNLELLRLEILNLEESINELEITKQILLKNLNNIKYFQEKIQSRISLNLKYKIIVH